jgi:hypothetical protein
MMGFSSPLTACKIDVRRFCVIRSRRSWPILGLSASGRRPCNFPAPRADDHLIPYGDGMRVVVDLDRGPGAGTDRLRNAEPLA